MMKRLPLVTFGLFLLAMVAVSAQAAAAPAKTSTVVYVSDFGFDFNAAPVQQPIFKPVPLGERVGYGRPEIPLTPEQRARHLVDLMSQSLLDDLRQAGIPARRLSLGTPPPSSGWFVRGAFLQVDADGELHRTVTGFGAGSTQIEVVATVDQLHAGPPAPLYTIDSAAQSGKFPDAVVTLNPNMALGRFVLSGLDLERNVRDVAGQIADQVKMQITVDPSEQSKTR